MSNGSSTPALTQRAISPWHGQAKSTSKPAFNFCKPSSASPNVEYSGDPCSSTYDPNRPSSSYPPQRKTLPGSSAKTFEVENNTAIKTVNIATPKVLTKKFLVS